MDEEYFKKRYGSLLVWAQHEDQKRRWPWYGRLYHWLFLHWFCGACKLGG